MYMAGRPLPAHHLKWQPHLPGVRRRLRISFAGGADAFNIDKLFAAASGPSPWPPRS
jgi:hypothetical protein